jgi:hypothetical protein
VRDGGAYVHGSHYAMCGGAPIAFIRHTSEQEWQGAINPLMDRRRHGRASIRVKGADVHKQQESQERPE